MNTYDGASEEALLHRLLLRVAGRLPDDNVTSARAALAEGRAAEVREYLTGNLAAAQLRPADEDLALLAPADSAVDAALRAGQPLDDAAPPPYDFQADLPDFARYGPELPPMIDLSLGEQDAEDRAAAAAATQLSTAVALWRSWRTTVDGPDSGDRVRVYVLELDTSTEELATAAAYTAAAIAVGGLPAPQVEVYATGSELPSYQRRARDSSALLWAAEVDGQVQVARIFDVVDPDSGPRFDDGHTVLDDADRESVLRYLDDSAVLLSTTQRMVDVIHPELGEVVGMDYRTDGEWVWTDSVSYYLRTYGLAPDAALSEHIQANNFVAPDVSAIARHRAIAELFRPTEEEAVWSA